MAQADGVETVAILDVVHNFEIFSAEAFIAAFTQHIPDKGFKMVRYCGWYSNRARGERAKREAVSGAPKPTAVEVIDVSKYHQPRIPSKKWRQLIKKVWEVDPLICPHCGVEMKLIALIDDDEVIEKILRHLKLWPEQAAPTCLSRARAVCASATKRAKGMDVVAVPRFMPESMPRVTVDR